MKKTKTDLYNKVTFTNLKNQYKIVKSNCKNKRKVFEFSRSLNINLYDIGLKLRNNRYEFSKYNIFLIHEKKYRIIMSESIQDKIVSHFISNYCLKNFLSKKLILQNVSTRENLGSKAAYDFFEKGIRKIGVNKKIYVLKIDISKYFYSISHKNLKDMLKKDLKDDFALDLIYKIIDLTDEPYINHKIDELIETEKKAVQFMNIQESEKKNLINELNKVPRYEKGFGLSIGCVINQLLSIYYLNCVDRFIKENLKCKHYVRYMDDIVILSDNKEKLKNYFEKITKEIRKIDLHVNPKSNIYFFNNGFTFLGKTYWISNNKLYFKTTNKTYHKAKKRLNKKRKTDFKEYYLSKASYFGIIPEDKLHSLDEEVNFLQNLYEDVLIIKEDVHGFSFDENSVSFKEFNKQKKYKNFTAFLKASNIKHIVISRTVVKFYNIA